MSSLLPILHPEYKTISNKKRINIYYEVVKLYFKVCKYLSAYISHVCYALSRIIPHISQVNKGRVDIEASGRVQGSGPTRMMLLCQHTPLFTRYQKLCRWIQIDASVKPNFTGAEADLKLLNLRQGKTQDIIYCMLYNFISF